MKNFILNIRRVYNVQGLVFNVDTNGSKKRYDSIFCKYYGYASADNVKHCVTEKFIEISGAIRPERTYCKKYNEADTKKDEQSNIITMFDLKNPHIRINGVWNPNPLESKGEKYHKCSLKSIINYSDMLPLHVLLTSMDKESGVNCGSISDSIAIKYNDKLCFTPNELSEIKNIPLEEAEEYFRDTRTMNFFNKNEVSSGIYYVDYHINLTNLFYTDITDTKLTEDEVKDCEENGYKFYQKNNNKVRCAVPIDVAVDNFKSLIQAIFEWDFLSNNSVHGSMKEPLRTTISLNNTALWQQSTIGVLTTDNKATICLAPQEDEIDNGIYSFNTLLLKQFVNDDKNTYSMNADNNAMKKAFELFENSIGEIAKNAEEYFNRNGIFLM